VKDNSDFLAVCSMTFDKGLKSYATIMGVNPGDAVRSLEDAGADVIGSNCGRGIEEIIDVAQIMRPATELPLWFKPNAGMPELVDGMTVYPHTPEFMAMRIPDLIDAGASVVGGCCGSTPEHIRKIREIVDAVNV
jgi:5-methyltetrahydrofolate--homocysteine methyltransferase